MSDIELLVCRKCDQGSCFWIPFTDGTFNYVPDQRKCPGDFDFCFEKFKEGEFIE